MPSVASKRLFAAMKQLMPDLPNGITKMRLTLSVDSPPEVECEYLVQTLGFITKERETFHIAEEKEVTEQPCETA